MPPLPLHQRSEQRRALQNLRLNAYFQGADILAYSDDSSHQYQVYVPDFFHGKPAEHSWVPPDTPEKRQKFGEFLNGPASAANNVPKIPSLVREITKKSGGIIQRWGAVGLCWGGKVRVISYTFPSLLRER